MPYYIANNPDVSRTTITMAHAAPYERLVTAMHDMGGGVVFDANGDIVVFHERHADLIFMRNSARMLNA